MPSSRAGPCRASSLTILGKRGPKLTRPSTSATRDRPTGRSPSSSTRPWNFLCTNLCLIRWSSFLVGTPLWVAAWCKGYQARVRFTIITHFLDASTNQVQAKCTEPSSLQLISSPLPYPSLFPLPYRRDPSTVTAEAYHPPRGPGPVDDR